MQHRVAQKQSEQDVLLGRRANSTNVMPMEARIPVTCKACHYWFGLDSGLLDSESGPE